MDVLIQPFVLISSLFILIVEVAVFARLTLQRPPESADTRYTQKAQKKRTKGIIFSFLILVLMIIYYITRIYKFYRKYYMPRAPQSFLLGSSRILRMLELWIESLQKSFLFYIVVLIIPFISSKRFRVLHIKEDTSEAFVEWYSLIRVFSYPLIFVIFKDSAFGVYLIEVLSLSETCLLLSMYSLLLSKIVKLEEILAHTQVVTRYEIEAVISEIRSGVLGLLLYLGLDLVSRIVTIVLFFFPEENNYLIISDVNSLARIVLFVQLYYYIAKLVFLPSKGVCESIQKMEDVKKHATGSFLNLSHRETDENNTVPLTAVPNI